MLAGVACAETPLSPWRSELFGSEETLRSQTKIPDGRFVSAVILGLPPGGEKSLPLFLGERKVIVKPWRLALPLLIYTQFIF